MEVKNSINKPRVCDATGNLNLSMCRPQPITGEQAGMNQRTKSTWNLDCWPPNVRPVSEVTMETNSRCVLPRGRSGPSPFANPSKALETIGCLGHGRPLYPPFKLLHGAGPLAE